jgi:hypothetical protein
LTEWTRQRWRGPADDLLQLHPADHLMADRFLESDEDWRNFLDYLRDRTPLRMLNGIEAREVFREIALLGYRILKPGQHPSGLDTTVEAITTVRPRMVVGTGRTGRQEPVVEAPYEIAKSSLPEIMASNGKKR